MYRLLTSISDRRSFDLLVKEYGAESARLSSEDDLNEVIDIYFRRVGVNVDDVDEARARFYPAFREGWYGGKG